ncbi:MAG: 50S ribosomal protein L6 [Patescibacteria group bacterium]
MSRIGKKPISIPSGVTVSVVGNEIKTKGPKGELSLQLPKGVSVEVEAEMVRVLRANDNLQTRANHGLVRSMLANNIEGVSAGFKKTLKLVGTGYRVAVKGTGLTISVGYSHPVEVQAVAGVTFKVEGNDTINVEGIDKQLVGQVASDIREIRSPEPYKGKGIRYENEYIKIKPGKTAA